MPRFALMCPLYHRRCPCYQAIVFLLYNKFMAHHTPLPTTAKVKIIQSLFVLHVHATHLLFVHLATVILLNYFSICLQNIILQRTIGLVVQPGR